MQWSLSEYRCVSLPWQSWCKQKWNIREDLCLVHSMLLSGKYCICTGKKTKACRDNSLNHIGVQINIATAF